MPMTCRGVLDIVAIVVVVVVVAAAAAPSRASSGSGLGSDDWHKVGGTLGGPSRMIIIAILLG